jgi:hypothetical protein
LNNMRDDIAKVFLISDNSDTINSSQWHWLSVLYLSSIDSSTETTLEREPVSKTEQQLWCFKLGACTAFKTTAILANR